MFLSPCFQFPGHVPCSKISELQENSIEIFEELYTILVSTSHTGTRVPVSSTSLPKPALFLNKAHPLSGQEVGLLIHKYRSLLGLHFLGG